MAVASDSPAIHVTIDATALMKVGIGAGYICPIVSTGIARSLARNDIPFVSPVDLRIRIAFNPNARDLMLAAVPSLRAFAISLCRNADRADDLVQETLLRALSHIDSFQPATNMSAWLFTILRNHFRSEYRKRRREVEDVDGSFAEKLESQPNQTSHLEFQDSVRRSQSFRSISAKDAS